LYTISIIFLFPRVEEFGRMIGRVWGLNSRHRDIPGCPEENTSGPESASRTENTLRQIGVGHIGISGGQFAGCRSDPPGMLTISARLSGAVPQRNRSRVI
jgi:hypothetical protein